MTSGRLAAVDIAAGVNTSLYTTPEAKPMEVTVNIANRNDKDVIIRLALLDGAIGTLDGSDYIEYDVTIRAKGLIERSGIQMSPHQSLVGYSDTGNVSFQVWS